MLWQLGKDLALIERPYWTGLAKILVGYVKPDSKFTVQRWSRLLGQKAGRQASDDLSSRPCSIANVGKKKR